MQHHPRPIPLIRSLEVAPQTPLIDALALMNQAESDRPSTVLVVQNSQLVGTLSAQDVVRLATAGSQFQTMSVAEGMNRHPVTLTTAEAQISTILNRFQQHRLSDLPIVNEHHQVQGLVTLESLNRVLSAEWQQTDRFAHSLLAKCPTETVQGDLMVEGVDIDITARKRSEEEIRFQAQLLDAVGQAAIATDLDGNITYWNRCAETLYGWKAQEVWGRPILEVTPAPAMKEAAAVIMSRLQVGESWSGEFTVQRRDGTTFEAMVILSPVYDESGLNGMIGVSSDISDRQWAERQLEESEARFQAFMEHSPAIAFIVDASGRAVYANSLIAQVLGTQTSKLIGQPNAVLPSEVLKQHRANDHQVLKTGQPIEVIESCPDQDGNWRNWLLCKFPLTSLRGETLVGGFGIDITERQRSEQALRDSEARFQEIAHTISQLFFVRSATTGQFLYVSPAYETLWGRTCKSLYQNPDSWLDSVHPENREQVLISLDKQFTEPVKREYRIIRPNGEIRWIFAHIELIRDESGPARFIGFAEDITERKGAEEALRQSQLRLQQLSTFIPAVLYSVVQRAEESLQFEYISSGVETIYEIEPERARQAANLIYQQILPGDREVFFERVRQTAQTLAPFRHEWQIMTPSGQQKWLQAVAQTERRPDGAIAWHGVMLDISARKQAELERQQTYQRLRFHLENTPLAVIEWDREFRVQRWSPQAQEMFGWQAEEVVGKRWSDWRFVLKEDLKAVKEAAQRLLNGSEPRHASSSRNLTKAGTVVHCEWYNSALLDDAGNVVSILSMAQNVTQRKQVEQKLRDREQFLRSIYDGVEPIFVVDVTPACDFRCVSWNPSAASFMRLKAEEIEDKTFEEILDSKPAALARERFKLCLQVGTTIVGENYLNVAGGTWWTHTLTPLRDEQGDIYRIVGTASNITERKQIEQERDRLLQRVEQHNQILETCVGERTAELEQTNEQLQQEISDRQQVEKALRDSEERYRLIFNQAAVGIAQTTLDGRYLQANQKLCDILGYSLEELYEQINCFDITHPDNLDISDDYVRRILAGEIESYSLEKRYIRKNGSPIWVQIFIKLLRDSMGNPLYFINVVEDISDRKQAEEALSLSEQKFRGAFDTIAVGMVIVAVTGGFVEVNGALCRMLDYSETELLRLSFHEITHPEDLSADIHLFEQMIAGEVPAYQAEKRYRRKDGQLMWGWLSISLMRSQGQPLYFIAQIQDISDRKRAEAQIQSSKARLAEAQRIAHMGSWEFEISTKKITWSAELFNIFARDPAQGEPTYSQLVQLIYPGDREFFQQTIEQAIATGESYTIDDLKILRPNGSVRHTESRGEAIDDAQGVIKLFGTAMDITERKQAEALLNQKSERERLTMAIAQHIRQSLHLDEILATTVREVRQLLQADRVSVFRLCPDGFGRVVAEAIFPGQPSILNEEFPDEVFPDECQEVYSQGRARIVPDVATDEVAYCIAKFLAEIGVKSKLSVPILQANKLWGVMTVHHCSEVSRSWQQWELELLEELALQLAIAIGQSALYQQLQAELRERERSLAEKEVLLKEIHHRVKNNLQIISSLLWMQSQQVDTEALSLFKDSQSRVQTMALIHEQLYQSPDIAQIDFEQYLQTLIRSLFRSYGVSGAIALDINVNAPPLSIDIALPCGLIVSELVSNALKYAFPERQSGKIWIDFGSDAELVLSVSDNGIGLPQDLDFRNSVSLGLLVVCDLTEQLDGTIELNRSDGTTFEITFPHPRR